VCIRRLRNMNMRQRQPSLELLQYMLNRERTRHHSAVGRDTHKTSVVAQASPIPSVPDRQASHHSLTLL
jgi:hypothetical protein